MANESDLNEALEYHSINLVVYEFNIHYRIRVRRILDWWIKSYVKAVQFNHLFVVPNPNLTVQRRWDKVSVLRLDGSQRSYCPGVTFEYVDWLLTVILNCWYQGLFSPSLFLVDVDVYVFKFDQLSEMDVAAIVRGDEKLLLFEN